VGPSRKDLGQLFLYLFVNFESSSSSEICKFTLNDGALIKLALEPIHLKGNIES